MWSSILKTLKFWDKASIPYWWLFLLILVYDNRMWLEAFCHLVDFVNISDIQLQFKNVSFTCSRDWNKLTTMILNELNKIVDQFLLLCPLMIMFNIDEFGELLKHTCILALQHIVGYYPFVESGMIMTLEIGFGNCPF